MVKEMSKSLRIVINRFKNACFLRKAHSCYPVYYSQLQPLSQFKNLIPESGSLNKIKLFDGSLHLFFKF